MLKEHAHITICPSEQGNLLPVSSTDGTLYAEARSKQSHCAVVSLGSISLIPCCAHITSFCLIQPERGVIPIRQAEIHETQRLDCRGYPVTKRILVVDDKAHLLRLMRMILEDEHYQVSILQEGRGAFDRVKESLPDLVILDLKLADSSGLDILRDLKADRATADIPVIVYTAAVLEAEEVSQLISSDPTRYHGVRVLQKPFDLDALLGLVQDVLGAGDLC
jgi:CheY-like chemotaxis protein